MKRKNNMHIYEEASPTIIGQMVTPKNIGDFFLESSYYFYCWDDLMELEYGQCVRNKKNIILSLSLLRQL